MATPQIAGSIDTHLGAASARFFGEGFKRVAHEVTGLVITGRPGLGCLTARAQILYPRDWSSKSHGALRPHLSSVDALVLAAQLAEAHLVHRYALTVGQ